MDENLHMSARVTTVTYTKERVEELAKALKEGDFKIRWCLETVFSGCEDLEKGFSLDEINARIELVDRIIPLAMAFPVEDVWEAMCLQSKHHFLNTKKTNIK